MSDKAVRVRFRYEDDSVVLTLPADLKRTGALAPGAEFQWPALGKALGFGSGPATFTVAAVGTEGNPLGEGDLVIHVV